MPWMTQDIKLLIKRKHRIFQRWKRNTSDITKENLTVLQNDLTQMIDEAKKQYVDNLVKKLNDPNTSQKPFWSAFS